MTSPRHVKTERAPLPRDTLGDLWSAGRVPAALFAVLALIAGMVFDALTHAEALVLALGMPLVAMGVAAAPFRFEQGNTKRIGLGVAIAVAVVAEAVVLGTVFPGAPLGEATLDPDSPRAQIELPAGMRRVDLRSTASLDSSGSAAQGVAHLVAARGDAEQGVVASFQHVNAQSRRSRGSSGSSSSVHTSQSTHQELALDGEGPLELRLERVTGQIGPVVRVAVFPQRLGGVAEALLVLGLGSAAAAVQWLAHRRQVTPHYAAGAGAALAMAVYVHHRLDGTSGLWSVFGAILASVAVGGGLGWAISIFLRRFAPAR